MRRVPGTPWLLAAAVAVGSGVGAAAVESLEADALRLCAEADRLHGEARAATLERALGLANQAAAGRPESADAHFAVFCALGKQLAERGVGLRSLGAIRRLRSAVDRTLELDPDHVDALIGKGRMLLRLPRLLGGDPTEAARCLERARRLGPEHPVVRTMVSGASGIEATAASH